MCGRFTLRTSPAVLVEVFELLREPELTPRYNIAPTQAVAVIRGAGSGRELTMMHWGLVPSWEKDPSGAARRINARSEKVSTTPAFRSAFRHRRCLVPADGFYEWKKVGTKKQPYYFTLRSGEPFAFAGLWEHWGHNGSALHTCAILTGEPNELAGQIHDRMPVILRPEDHDRWLDPREKDADALQTVLTPYPAEEMEMQSVSTRVNSPRNDSPECIAPPERGGLF